MASDYNGPATFVLEGEEYQVVVAVTGAGNEMSTGGVPTGEVTRETFTTDLIQLVGGSIPDAALDKTGELRCADGQEFTGEFNARGEFRPADIS